MSPRPEELRLERELFVRSLIPAMRGDAAARLAGAIQPLDVPANSWLFRAGDPPDQFYFLIDGQVSMEMPGQPAWIFGPRSLVGMIDLTLWRPHRRGCRTTRPTRLLVGRSTVWLDMLEDDALLAQGAIQTLSLQLHALSRAHGHLLPAPTFAPAPRFEKPMLLYEKVLVLRDTPLFVRAGTQAIASLAQVAEQVELAAGATLFARGEAHRTLFIVAEGQIELTLDPDHIERSGPLSILGTAAALSGELGVYSARALTASLLLRLREEDYYDVAEEHPELTRAVLAYLAIERERIMDLAPPRDES